MTGRGAHKEWIGKKPTSAVPQRVKLRILERQKKTVGKFELVFCAECNGVLVAGDGIEFDHIVALQESGTHSESNLQAIHRRCHRGKTSTEATERATSRRKRAKAFGLKKEPHRNFRKPASFRYDWAKRRLVKETDE